MTSRLIASRRAPASALRRTSEIVLVGATVVAVIAAFGPVWAVRLGVAVAVVAAVVACAFAWRELFSARRLHAKEMLEAARDHGSALAEERSRNAAVVDLLSRRIADAGAMIERQRVTIAELCIKISSLKSDRSYLKGEVDHRESVISSLRDTVRAREAELIALRDETEASVHHMPRRILADHASLREELSATDGPSDDASQPTGVDLNVVDLSTVLPNYEVGGRRVG